MIITCGLFERKTKNRLVEVVTSTFGVEADLMECTLEISDFYNPARRQYNADMILEAMSARAPEGYLRYMNIFRRDLFIPILTYIFGQAQLNGKYGIASLYRLRNELYGLPADDDLMRERLSKVVVHELGHTFGLIHCRQPFCVMRSSTYVEDLDQKGLQFCPHCREQLDERLKRVRDST